MTQRAASQGRCLHFAGRSLRSLLFCHPEYRPHLDFSGDLPSLGERHARHRTQRKANALDIKLRMSVKSRRKDVPGQYRLFIDQVTWRANTDVNGRWVRCGSGRVEAKPAARVAKTVKRRTRCPQCIVNSSQVQARRWRPWTSNHFKVKVREPSVAMAHLRVVVKWLVRWERKHPVRKRDGSRGRLCKEIKQRRLLLWVALNLADPQIACLSMKI